MPEIEVPQPPSLEKDVDKMSKLKELRSLVEEGDDFKRRTDDIFLSRYLNACDWNVKDAFQKMMKIFKLKTDNPEWFLNKAPSNYKDLLERNIKFMLDKRDKNGRRIYVTKLGNLNTSETSVQDLAHLDDLWFELMLNELDTQCNGVSCVIDMNGYSLKSLRFLTPNNVRVGSQKADLLPLKHMEFHIVNSSMFLNAAVALVYPVLSKQIKDHVHFHYSDWSNLHNHLGRDCLPAEYGGTDGAVFDLEKIYSNLYEKEDHFNDILMYGYSPKSIEDCTDSSMKKYKKKKDKKKREKDGEVADVEFGE